MAVQSSDGNLDADWRTFIACSVIIGFAFVCVAMGLRPANPMACGPATARAMTSRVASAGCPVGSEEDVGKEALAVSEYQSWTLWWQASASVAALIAASAAAVAAFRAASEAAKNTSTANQALAVAQRTYEVEHRPWLGLRDVEVDGGMSFYAGQTSVGLKMKLENKGNVPAVEILLYAKIFSNAQQTKIRDYIEELVNSYSDVKRSVIAKRVPEKVVFPGQSTEWRQELAFKVEEASHPFGSAGLLFSPMITLVICYRSPFDDATKFAACTFNLLINGAAFSISSPTQAIAPIDPERLRLAEWFTGWTAG